MEKRNLANKELDRIGIAMLKASALPADELERVIDDPYLFSSIKRRVRFNENTRTKTASSWSGLFTLKTIAGGVSMAVVVVAVFGLVSIKSLIGKQSAEVVKAPASQSTSQPALPLISVDDATVDEPKSAVASSVSRRVYQAEQAVIRTRSPHRTYTEPAAEPENVPRTMEFYPLAGTMPDQMGEGRIVRVDLPRASLVALGVNLPPDSGKAVVKTDLLVGQDGVPRAIRIVD